jgi:GNAT superfamily N-acetyltransferase
MPTLNWDERQMLREIQAHLCALLVREGAAREQISTVDVYYHTSNMAPRLNTISPHKGVAWVRRDDVIYAAEWLTEHKRRPRLFFLDSLFPGAFQQQLQLMGLALEDEKVIIAYRPLYGPVLPDEIPLGRLIPEFEEHISAEVIDARKDLAIWQRVFNTAYYNAETLTVSNDQVDRLAATIEAGENLYVLACYDHMPLGVARVILHPPAAELELISVIPLWHGMGLENALIITAANAAMDLGCDTIFAVEPDGMLLNSFRRLGFVEVSHILTYSQS